MRQVAEDHLHAERRRRGPLVVFPFLIGGGDHVAVDLPRRLGLEDPNHTGPDAVFVARPFGALSDLPDLVAESFTHELRGLAA